MIEILWFRCNPHLQQTLNCRFVQSELQLLVPCCSHITAAFLIMKIPTVRFATLEPSINFLDIIYHRSTKAVSGTSVNLTLRGSCSFFFFYIKTHRRALSLCLSLSLSLSLSHYTNQKPPSLCVKSAISIQSFFFFFNFYLKNGEFNFLICLILH